MAIRYELVDGEEDVQVADDVVVLGVDGVAAIYHGIRSGALLGEMHYGLWLVTLYYLRDELPVKEVAELNPYLLPGDFFPCPNTLLEVGDGGEARRGELVVDGAAHEVVYYDDLVTVVREMQGGGSSAISVSTQDQYLHYRGSPF